MSGKVAKLRNGDGAGVHINYVKVTVLGLGSMPPKPRQPRLPAALRSALAQIQAGAAPQDIAADLIRKHAERVVLGAHLPPGDPRVPAVEALTRALEMRTFDDSAISLDVCLRDAQEVGIGGR